MRIFADNLCSDAVLGDIFAGANCFKLIDIRYTRNNRCFRLGCEL